MRVACREVAICGRVFRILLDAKKEFWDRLIVAPAQEMSDPDASDNQTDVSARTEPQCGFISLDRNIRLACPRPKDAAYVPAACETWIEGQRMVDRGHRGAHILTEIGQHNRSIRLGCPDHHRPLARHDGRNRCPCERLPPDRWSSRTIIDIGNSKTKRQTA